MRDVADAVREGAWAYLMRQAKALLPLVFLVTAILYFTAETTHGAVQIGRAAAFFLGALFSWLVGFVGMNLAVRGNLRVAAAARTSYGNALQLGYRTGHHHRHAHRRPRPAGRHDDLHHLRREGL